ncbi:MAG: glycine dehydrogenase (aminomethyl-transferring), partial [Deltaproteobacteria bacterium]|nr:glycine dehydrogenase (aminomethyl-transferring) [Deltaproteobacteria bacterium]
MLEAIGASSLDELSQQTVPASILRDQPLAIPEGLSEAEALEHIAGLAAKNKVLRSHIGMGYYGTHVPPVILRNVLENPGWYTQYTPYQAEIAQGRLEALINFQTMVSELCSLPLSNASLLDEATAAAEGMSMCRAISRGKKNRFYVSDRCHPQTIAVVRTRAEPMGIELEVGPMDQVKWEGGDLCGILVQYPDTDGAIHDWEAMARQAHDVGALVVCCTDLLALTLLEPPGEWGADIAVGSSQRFGVPMGYGGPHAAFMATREEFRRQMPGRIIGVSKDSKGRVAYRLALQTREQHIRRDRATSNICTAQVLLAITASMYAVYHGPEGLKVIAGTVHRLTSKLASGLRELGFDIGDQPFFDTLRVKTGQGDGDRIAAAALAAGINVRRYPGGDIGISFDETTTEAHVSELLSCFGEAPDIAGLAAADQLGAFARSSEFLTHEVFHRYQTEHEMLRYLNRLQSRDLSLTTSMIPLGSCTMKLNAAAEMFPISEPGFARLHPFAPLDQATGYAELFSRLETW